jgi:GNAT superfamily N-acetyltransferase
MFPNQSEVIVRQYVAADWDAVLDICIAAFTTIHEGFERALGRELFQLVYPDWKASKEAYLRSLCESDGCETMLVGELQGSVAGFSHYEVDQEKSSGRLGLNAVHPRWQRHGVASSMYERVFQIMRGRGLKFVQVGTGGDAAHVPARAAYEKCGFSPIPVVNYFKQL